MNEKSYPRGSEWRRWDLHIHTPGTKKSDQFKGKNGSSDLDDKWAEYIKTINDYEGEIAVLGITDYFSVENYFKFKEKQANGEITKQIDLIIPNVELRILPVTGSSKPINIHCLFDPDFADQIEPRFLQKLTIRDGETEYNASRQSLVEYGQAISQDQKHPSDEWFTKKGISKFTTTLEHIQNIYRNDKRIRENMLVIVANGKDGVSGAKSHKDYLDQLGKESSLRTKLYNIYKFSDAIFSSTPSDLEYFSGKKTSLKTLKAETGGPMPCFHGCDAHNNIKILEPDEKRYCWIKADPTFNGLRQTLYEPSLRVKIQETIPETKIPYDLIDKIVFNDCKDVFNKEIVFNSGLNCIIGGRSTGKSTLLSCIAKQLNYEEEWDKGNHLKDLDYKKNSKNKFLKSFLKSSTVIWKNGKIANDSKIEYFPQGYMSEFAREKHKFNNLVKGMLRSRDGEAIYETLRRQELNNRNNISSSLRLLFDIINQKLKKQEEQKRLGNREGIELELHRLEIAIKAIQEQNADQEELLISFNKQKLDIEQQQHMINSANQDLNQLAVLEHHQLFSTPPHTNLLSNELGLLIDKQYNIIIEKAKHKWQEVLATIRVELQKQKITEQKKIEKIQTTEIYRQGQIFLSENKNLEFLIKAQETEAIKYTNFKKLDTEIKLLNEEIITLETGILQKHFSFYEYLAQAAQELSKEYKDLKIASTANFKSDEYRDILWNSINKKSDSNKDFARAFNWDSDDNYKKEIESKFKTLLSGQVALISGNTNQSLLQDLLARSPYELSYDIIYEGDKYNDMSEGKQAFVILKLVLEFNNRTCPLLIDQPEDDLDNRAIYNELVEYLRTQKLKRQIILVTHNPNIVIGTDSELVIIANQHGKNSKNKDEKKFQYLTGAIEHSYTSNNTALLELERQGIREHICEVLEGGEFAFKKREERYALKK
ncbi:MAG: TrlF family AAA-like ATPase [Aureispira sp.]